MKNKKYRMKSLKCHRAQDISCGSSVSFQRTPKPAAVVSHDCGGRRSQLVLLVLIITFHWHVAPVHYPSLCSSHTYYVIFLTFGYKMLFLTIKWIAFLFSHFRLWAPFLNVLVPHFWWTLMLNSNYLRKQSTWVSPPFFILYRVIQKMNTFIYPTALPFWRVQPTMAGSKRGGGALKMMIIHYLWHGHQMQSANVPKQIW